ncbi:MAG: dTMP kinase [Candidatus Dormibacteria bacterium]
MTASDGGFFITVEGLDGCGKTTQAGLLAEALSKEGHPVKVVRDPGTTALGERLRELLLEPTTGWALEGWAEAALFLAARVQLAKEVIYPALARCEVVVSDRYLDSNLVYQGARGIPWDGIMELHRICGVDRLPDLTLILDLPVATAKGRRGGDLPLDRLESESTQYHERVRAGYQAVARHFPTRAVMLQADQSPGDLAMECQRVARERLATRRLD